MNHLIIIPTYNEAKTVEKIISAIFNMYDNFNILIVDDSSPDGTANIIEKLKENYPKLHLLVQDKKYGLARAYINGMKWGIENGFDVFSTCDADYSHNPKHFQDVLKYLNEGYNALSGSRYIEGGNTQETNWFKNLISIGGNNYARLILGKEMHDWTDGFNTYTKEALDKINLDSIKSTGYIMHAEMKYKAMHSGCKLKEFPIDFAMREEGYSKMSFHIIFEAFIQVLKIRLGLL